MSMIKQAILHRLKAFIFLAYFVKSMSTDAWFDNTHKAVMQASGANYSSCLAIVPDALTMKLQSEAANHFSDIEGLRITSKDVLKQIELYDKVDDKGHLYGAIVSSAKQLHKRLLEGLYPNYYYGFMAHYIGDLSQPLHNSPYDTFNRANHKRIDGIVDDLPDLAMQISFHTSKLQINNFSSVIKNVVDLANKARYADKQLRIKGTMSNYDALQLLGHSATLLCSINVFMGIPTNSSVCNNVISVKTLF